MMKSCNTWEFLTKESIGTKIATKTRTVTTSMKFNVTEVEFDFDDMYSNDDFTCLSFDEEIELRDLALGVWEADDEDDLIEEVTAASGWCIKSIDYEIQLK